MKSVLIIGSGRSAGSLIEYLGSYCRENEYSLFVADRSTGLIEHEEVTTVELDIFDTKELDDLISKMDLIISMIPAHLHIHIAKSCLRMRKSLMTASYVSKEIARLDAEAKDHGLLFLMETGLDPGIDHMSAMAELDAIKDKGGKLTAFKSFTGGLISPESDDNPWNYKFTWNPRNVVLAGQGTVKFERNGRYKYIPYQGLFKRLEKLTVEGYGEFEGYPNRDSLKYKDIYGLQDIPTIFRGTLRRPGFCKSWDVFIQLGLTDDTYEMEGMSEMTYREYLNSFLHYSTTKPVEQKLREHLDLDDETMDRIEWIGLFEDKPVGLTNGTPAQVLQKLLEEKWKLQPDDKDMIVMQHQLEYILNDEVQKKVVSMVVKGENAEKTSMAHTVGLPLGIAAKLFLEDKLSSRGVQIPVIPELYTPILNELSERFDIRFFEENVSNS